MAAIPVVLNGTFTSDSGTTTGVFIGQLAYSDRGIGGGPIVPPEGPGTWPPQRPPHPSHPIVTPPPNGGEQPPEAPPPSIWPPGPGIDFPSHPIVLPDPGTPIPPGTLITWKAVWSEDQGWFIVGVPNVPHPAPSS